MHISGRRSLRSAGLAGSLRGQIVFEPEFRSADAVRGLEGFDYLWLIWGFSAVPREACSSLIEVPSEASVREIVRPTDICPADKTSFKATVRPPRLGGNERVGVFASRSPFRPNGLGLSSVKIASILDGPVIEVMGADLMDGTPIYDIKPYVEYADSHPGVRSGFVDSHGRTTLEVVLPPDAGDNGLDIIALKEVLSLDPRPSYHDDPSKVYGLSFSGHNVRFKVEGGVLTVLDID